MGTDYLFRPYLGMGSGADREEKGYWKLVTEDGPTGTGFKSCFTYCTGLPVLLGPLRLLTPGAECLAGTSPVQVPVVSLVSQ